MTDAPKKVRIVDRAGVYRRGQEAEVYIWTNETVTVLFKDGEQKGYARSLVEVLS